MADGYCEVSDVESVIQQTAQEFGATTADVESAIESQYAHIQRVTRRHWYDSTGSASDLVPTSPRSVVEEPHDAPSSPHPQPSHIHYARDVTYPRTVRGGYVRVPLDRRQVDSLNKLLVRSGDGYEDWVADSSRTQGRDGDYYVQDDPHSGKATLLVNASGLHLNQDYADVFLVSYDHGEDGVSGTIRRANALYAAANLVLNDDAQVATADDGQLVNLQTKAEQFREEADRLLEPYRTISTA